VAHFKLFFRTSVRSCRQRITLNTLSLLAVVVAVAVQVAAVLVVIGQALVSL